MILLLTERDEPTVNNVIDWLNFYNKKFVRINKEDDINASSVEINIKTNKTILKTSDKTIDLNEIESVYFRRGFLNLKHNIQLEGTNSKLTTEIKRKAIIETEYLKDFIYSELMTKKHLGNPNLYVPNKLTVLKIARKCGLDIPETIVTSNSHTANEFYQKNESIINKTIVDGIVMSSKNQYFSTKTITVNNPPQDFSISLFQNNILKKYELRIFYINEQFYTIAIFPDKNNSAVDTREVWDKQNASVFELPRRIQQKLVELTKAMNLNMGIIDIIYSTDNKYYFLEINPVGQYDLISFVCNIDLNQVIAQQLISN